MLEPKQYNRRPKTITAIEVTNDNIDELVQAELGNIRRMFYVDGNGDRQERIVAEIQANGPEAHPVGISPSDYFVIYDPEADRKYSLSAEEFNALYAEKPPTYINSDYSK